ncbi:hypothetical protein [Deinococcus radiophilus]|uniref:Uncharacterized protein n=1 Tax=Deinococcus radiophilus TaxID=32062 RepID=A0A431W5Y5_9DEIO|nr:hypothetical protein [Deinococcus radiophilus]RTR30754.1 hypothetical protein EJ104_00410 [Deinococcus radiophilus]UFA51307.1 hypothetical protein LMT64_05280 [Deinococcus radiophilus]
MNLYKVALAALFLTSLVWPSGVTAQASTSSPARPTLAQLVRLADQLTPDRGTECYGDVYCLLQRDLRGADLDERGWSAHWRGGEYTAQLDVWWDRAGRGLLLLDWNYLSQKAGCGDWPCGSSDLYAHRYASGCVQDVKFSQIGVPYRAQAWSEVKPTLPAAVRADASARVLAFRRLTGENGELYLDPELPQRGTDITVFVGDHTSRLPIYRLRWDAARGVFLPAVRTP